jgi:hypothetical protein
MAGRLKTSVAGLWPVALLIALLWLVRFARSAEFGLYEDDLTRFSSVVRMTMPDLARHTLDTIGDLSRQGTPVKQSLLYWLPSLGWNLGGLQALYFLGFAILAVNAGLFYTLMKDLQGGVFALCAGLAYVLYSADTTQAFLTHAFVLQVSIALVLLALLAYRRRRVAVAFALAIVALLTYETAFVVFLGAPLLTTPWDRAWRRRLLVHVLLCGLCLAAVFSARYAAGEGRVRGLSLAEAATIPLVHMIEGPPVALATYVYRPLQVVTGPRVETIVVSLLTAAGLTWLLRRLRFGTDSGGQEGSPSATDAVTARPIRLSDWRQVWSDLPPEVRTGLRLALTGLVLLVLAYPLTLTVRAFAISGRDTRVHTAGVIGASILVGALVWLIMGMAERTGKKKWVSLVLGIWLGILAGYGFLVQNDYANAWQLQREFWSQLVRLVPDVQEGSVILVDPSGLVDTRQIGANYWNLPRVLEQLYDFPGEWERPPRAYRMVPGWEARILTPDGRIRLDASTTLSAPDAYGDFDPTDVILIQTTEGQLTRISEPFPGVTGQQTAPPPDAGEPPYPTTLLYDLMVFPPTSS